MSEEYPPGVLASVSIEEQDIALGKDVHWVGRGAHLKNCFIDIRGSGRRFSLVDCTLEDCTIKTRRPLNDVQFRETRFLSCRFEGTYRGCEFGGFPFEDYPQVGGAARRCDFSSATMDACRFGIDCEENRWPGWPHIVFLDPPKHEAQWQSLPLCLSLKWQVFQDLNSAQPDFVTACVQNLEMLDPQVDPESSWPYIQELPWLTFAGKASKPRVEMPEAPPPQYEAPRPLVHTFINEGWLEEVRWHEDSCQLLFDMTRAVARSCLPDRLVLQLDGFVSGEWLVNGEERPLDDLPSHQFKVAGFEESEDALIFKGHIKKRGRLRLRCDKVNLLLADQSPVDIDDLSRAIESFWLEKMN